MAAASAQANASAAAEATARAVVAAQATAEALAQAMTMANAAAEAAATARTSVAVVPDIQTSVEAFIDPDCLIPVCEQTEEVRCPDCAPCDSCCEEPRETPTGCPEPQMVKWEFGQVQVGARTSSMKSIPTEIAAILEESGVVDFFQVESTFPTSATFSLDMGANRGSLSGTFPSSGLYTVRYMFIDRQQCPVVELIVLVSATGGRQETARACMTVRAAHETPGFLFFSGTIADIATQIVVDGSETYTTSFQLCGDEGQKHLLRTSAEITVNDEQVPFDRWEEYDPGSDSWETISEELALSVVLQQGLTVRAVYLSGGLEIMIEPTTPCITVSAVHQYMMVGTPTTYTQPLTETDPIIVTVVVDRSEEHTTAFDLCGRAGTQFLLQPQLETWTREQRRLVFSHWERYNAAEEVWVAFSEAQLLLVTIQQGGQIRAVYREASQNY
jgi:hypothetical protein